MILSIGLGLTAAVAVLFLGGFVYQQAGGRRDHRRFPPTGRILSAAACRLHLFEQGSGSPTVILEAGLAASSLSWSHVQPLIAKFTRVVSYDRAGLGWSDSCRSPRSLEGMIAELQALLDAAGVSPPFILVGHSFGGLLIRAFAHARPHDVTALVFVDPVSIRAWEPCSPADRARLKLGAKLSRRGAWLARLGVVRLALAAAALPNQRITKLIARTSAGPAAPLLGRLVGEVRKLPPAVLPVVRAHWSTPKAFYAMAAYLESLPDCAAAASRMPLPSDIPVVVLSAASAQPSELDERNAWVSSNPSSRHIQVNETGHWLHLEQPQIVADAVASLVAQVRSVRHRVHDVVHPDAKS